MKNVQSYRVTACMELVKMAVDNLTLDNLHSVVEKEIALSSSRIEDAVRCKDEWFLEVVTDDECSRIEQLLGLAFVSAQSFITTVRTRIAILSDRVKNIDKPLSFVNSPNAHEILKLVDMAKSGSKYTEIEVINAVANYWKHQEEWPTGVESKGEYLERVWDQAQMGSNQKHTAEIVISIGMSPSCTGNMRTACEALGVTNSYLDLSPLREKLHNWAQFLQVKAESEVKVLGLA